MKTVGLLEGGFWIFHASSFVFLPLFSVILANNMFSIDSFQKLL